MKYVIGLDGGGTKTLGYIANLEGRILGAHLGGPTNYRGVGKANAKDALDEVISSLCNNNDIDIKDVEVISLGLAGVDRPEDKNVIMEILENANENRTILINNDATTSLVGANSKIEGIITICGTGSISLGIDATGKIIRSGGWGHIIGDEGSGYDLGKQALIAVAKAHDQRGKQTLLTDAIIEYLGLKAADEIIGYVYSNLNTKNKIAQLAPIIFQCYELRDEISEQIIENAVSDLVEMTEAVIKQLSFNKGKVTISLAGGIFEHVLVMREKFIGRLNEQFDHLYFQRPIFDGGIGALILGWHALGVNVDINKLKNETRDVNHNDK